MLRLLLSRKEVTMPRKGDQSLLRDHNRRLIVGLLRSHGPVSRTALAQLTGLSPSALTRSARYLLAEGIARETGKTQSNGGRRAVLLAFNPTYAYGIGIKVERERVLAARVDLAGRIAGRWEAPLPAPPTPDQMFSVVRNAVRRLARGRILGVGVAISGFVDAHGVDLYSPILGWRNVAVGEPLADRLGLSVRVENDVNALALAEDLYGAGLRFQDFVCVTVGEGVGAGVVIAGELYRGAFGGAGEIGHMTIALGGPRCRCGENGCLEALGSDQALRAEAEGLGFGDVAAMAAAARAGDPRAQDVFCRVGRVLGIGLKNVVNLLNPEAIVLGGERMADADLFLPALEEEVRRRAFPETARELAIVPAELGPDGFLIGAATLVSTEAFRSPLEQTG
ncbi:TPA: ROK family transcriptional regulator [Candidatus Acetothermia bacterium]|nr:ROK family transcriptional regulator [Candidatus Acetothermia bacterium]